MKLVATFLVAVFVVVAGTSFAFGDCAGHSKAQMVKSQPQEQMSQDQSVSQNQSVSKDQPAGTSFTVAEKGSEPASPVVKTSEKK
jgi:hypothetical protein